MHLRLFEEARNFLMDEFDVRLGIISPTNDGYKQYKSSLIHSKYLFLLQIAPGDMN